MTDEEAVDAFEYLARTEGIIPAIESAHAVAHARKLAASMAKGPDPGDLPVRPGRQGLAAIARYRGEGYR